MKEGTDVLLANLPDENSENETYLSHHLLLTFASLPAPVKLGMLDIFVSQGFRHVLSARHESVRALMLNIEEKDPVLHKVRYDRLRTELMLLEDILDFLDKGKEQVTAIIASHQPDDTSTEG